MKFRFIAVVACAAFGSSACGSDDETSSGSIAITLKEDTISASPATASAGAVDFMVSNTGREMHEFVVIKTDLPEDQLPMVDGAVDEEAAGLQVMGEIEDIPAGGSGHVTLQLSPGKYVLICNIVEQVTGMPSHNHYDEGMHKAFVVN